MKKNIFILFALSILLVGCNGGGKGDTTNNGEDTIQAPPQEVNKIAKAIFYLENSGSMFGFVNGESEYVKVVTELAEKPQFVEEKTGRKFNLINGGENIIVTKIGDEPSDLRNKLNVSGFRCGDVSQSNLTGMFKLALSKAKRDTISLLISDAIYDVGGSNPMSELAIEGTATRSSFIERLSEEDLQTIIIKLSSDFNGYYYPISGGSVQLNQKRPFYVFIFGKNVLLNKYFPDEYIKEKLAGYSDMARFLKLEDFNVPYKVTSHDRKGSFKFDDSNNKLLKVRVDNNNEFQFTFATNFSTVPFSDSYLSSIDNYKINNNNYHIVDISKIKELELYGLDFDPTHIITVNSTSNPLGSIKISLINKLPNWIERTNSNNDDSSNIIGDSTHTFGLKYLTNGISDAYEYANQEANIVTFNFEINN